MRRIGLHLRLETTLVDLINKALRLNVDFFQCFLTLKSAGRVVPLNSSDIKEFVEIRRQHFKELYLHISYWVNPSTIEYNPHKLLKKELILAKRLEFTHVIFHPGSAKGALTLTEGIDALAKMVNKLTKKEPSFIFVLENIAQKFPSIGGNIDHFGLLLEKLDNVEKVKFCIDTAHAYSYGYNISNQKEQEKFINLLDEKIGLDRLCLIHLNDSQEALGSHIDRHAAIGEGEIGLEPLKRFVMHPQLKHVPLLPEPPVMSEELLKAELEKIKSWHSS
ncbi:deoxyribonuclease IV [Candidatus Dependentiae bacterium]